MPGALIDRPKMTKTMYQALKRHIMKERERKKQGIVCLQMERRKHNGQYFKLKPQNNILIKII